VVGRDAISRAGLWVVDVDAEDTREQVGAVLAGHLRVGRRWASPVASGYIEISIIAEIETAAVMAARPERENDPLALRIDYRRIRTAHLESGNNRPVLEVVLQDVADVGITIFIELRMKDEAVEHGQIGVQLGEIEREVGLLAAMIIRKRKDPALEIANEKAVCPRGSHEHHRELKLEAREREFDCIRRGRLGRACDL